MEKTYTINQRYTGNEVEVMTYKQLTEAIKSRIGAAEDGENGDTEVGYIGVEHNGVMYYGITYPSHGSQSTLRDGLEIMVWWNDEWNETNYQWLWEEPCSEPA